MSYLPLATEADVEALLARSEPVWLFKHSTACGVSTAAQDEIDTFLGHQPDAIIGRVIIQTHRPLSTWIAQRLGRSHQSPQLFLLKNGEITWATSHWGITMADMIKASA